MVNQILFVHNECNIYTKLLVVVYKPSLLYRQRHVNHSLRLVACVKSTGKGHTA